MTATTATTIEGVSVLSTNDGRPEDPFAIALSRRGIELRRRDHPAQLMSWDRVSRWEIKEREGDVLLILRGGGGSTPLVVPGWTLHDLEILMRDVTSDPGACDGEVATAPPPPEPAAASAAVTEAGPAPAFSRADRRRRRRVQPMWKPVVTVLLLCALAAAVTLVLLQSAGVINWGFLGPVA